MFSMSYNFSLLLWNRFKAVYLSSLLENCRVQGTRFRWPGCIWAPVPGSHLPKIKNPFLPGFLVVRRMINHQQLESLNICNLTVYQNKNQHHENKKDRKSRNLCAFGVQEAASFCIGITNLSISPQWSELLRGIYPPSKARSTWIKQKNGS